MATLPNSMAPPWAAITLSSLPGMPLTWFEQDVRLNGGKNDCQLPFQVFCVGNAGFDLLQPPHAE